jgi:hypothetical protein
METLRASRSTRSLPGERGGADSGRLGVIGAARMHWKAPACAKRLRPLRLGGREPDSRRSPPTMVEDEFFRKLAGGSLAGGHATDSAPENPAAVRAHGRRLISLHRGATAPPNGEEPPHPATGEWSRPRRRGSLQSPRFGPHARMSAGSAGRLATATRAGTRPARVSVYPTSAPLQRSTARAVCPGAAASCGSAPARPAAKGGGRSL